LVLSHLPDSDHQYIGLVLQHQAGQAKMPFRLVKPEANEPNFPARQSEAIQSAAAGDALIVEFNDAPAFLEMLDEASRRGVVILSLDRPLPPHNGKQHRYITYEPFSRIGGEIVQAAIEAAQSRQSAPGDRVLLLENRTPHRFRAERLESFVDAFKAAGRSYEIVSFEADGDKAAKALDEAFSKPGKIAIVLAEEDTGLFAAQRMAVERREQNRPLFVLGGYCAYDIRTPGDRRYIAVFADASVDAFAKKAFQTVASLMDGKTVPERSEVAISVHSRTTDLDPSNSELRAPPPPKSIQSQDRKTR
jgi:ABC-type sugar transport system substrate-binding protein